MPPVHHVPTDVSVAELLSAVADLESRLMEQAKGQTLVKTVFGSTFSIKDWADNIRSLFEGEKKVKWWTEQTIEKKDAFMQGLRRKQLSLNIYSGDFPSEERIRGWKCPPPEKGAESWLGKVVAKDLEILSQTEIASVSATTRDTLHEESRRILWMLGKEGLKLHTYYRLNGLAKFVDWVFKHDDEIAYDDEIYREVVASLNACYVVCDAAKKGGVSVTINGEAYMPNVETFANLWEELKNIKKDYISDMLSSRRTRGRDQKKRAPARRHHKSLSDVDMGDASHDNSVYDPVPRTATRRRGRPAARRELPLTALLEDIVLVYRWSHSNGSDAHDRLKLCFEANEGQNNTKLEWLLKFLHQFAEDEKDLSYLPAIQLLPTTAKGLDRLWQLSGNSDDLAQGKSSIKDPNFVQYGRWLDGEI
ncbi:uncharacterized protein JCM6883_003370 [Sporobolomyces salmoneus]|uniref:uncharacterized protein n=1 Tax=Sporobolomyces salmoneus TaxID=183962 RepID=UPI00316BC0AD